MVCSAKSYHRELGAANWYQTTSYSFHEQRPNAAVVPTSQYKKECNVFIGLWLVDRKMKEKINIVLYPFLHPTPGMVPDSCRTSIVLVFWNSKFEIRKKSPFLPFLISLWVFQEIMELMISESNISCILWSGTVVDCIHSGPQRSAHAHGTRVAGSVQLTAREVEIAWKKGDLPCKQVADYKLQFICSAICIVLRCAQCLGYKLQNCRQRNLTDSRHRKCWATNYNYCGSAILRCLVLEYKLQVSKAAQNQVLGTAHDYKTEKFLFFLLVIDTESVLLIETLIDWLIFFISWTYPAPCTCSLSLSPPHEPSGHWYLSPYYDPSQSLFHFSQSQLQRVHRLHMPFLF